MSMTDPIADMLTRIRNANAQKHSQVEMPASRMKKEIAKVLKQSRLIKDFETVKEGSKETIRVQLRYIRENVPVITGIKRISKPGLRVYVPLDKVQALEKGIGMVILSTPKGILSGSDAKKARTGGEVLCKVW
ncbi:MAG: 30S ribosomal protein S8 [Nitrospirae bacterium]|jgi:small subunit ribosomal protein S8|nr:30S ribosomal protein S8 [Nitrospirota bacterium]